MNIIWCIEKSSDRIPVIMKENGYVLCTETMSNWIYALREVRDKHNNAWIINAQNRQKIN